LAAQKFQLLKPLLITLILLSAEVTEPTFCLPLIAIIFDGFVTIEISVSSAFHIDDGEKLPIHHRNEIIKKVTVK